MLHIHSSVDVSTCYIYILMKILYCWCKYMLHIHSSVDVTCKYTFALYSVDVSTCTLYRCTF